MSRLHSLLALTVQQEGSDLHLAPNEPPRIRVNGALVRVRQPDDSGADVEQLIRPIMRPEHERLLEARGSVDFAYEAEDAGRFRVNVYRQGNGLGAALRVIPKRFPSLGGLDLPSSVTAAISQPRGLALVTGPTGFGKSTTLAAMVDHINASRRAHIITIEDPIEFVHAPRKSVVTQREVGAHTPSFLEALRDALREDPDVILVGEMRDAETIGLALAAAETGVQVLGTLHTNGAVRSINRVINAVPQPRQQQMRSVLADVLRLVVSQRLVQTTADQGRLMVAEVLVNNAAVASIIRSGKTHQLPSLIQSSGKSGMQTIDSQLRELVALGRITSLEAFTHAIDKTQFEQFIPRSEAA